MSNGRCRIIQLYLPLLISLFFHESQGFFFSVPSSAVKLLLPRRRTSPIGGGRRRCIPLINLETRIKPFLSSSSSSLEEDDVTTTTTINDDQKENNNEKNGLYVHIPYCRRRCRYCNFAIVPIGTKVQTEDFLSIHNNHDEEVEKDEADSSAKKATRGFRIMDESYRNSLLQEIDLIKQQQKRQRRQQTTTKNTTKPNILQSIYFGGGTPSLAPLETIQAILDALLLPEEDDDDEEDSPIFQLATNAEISIEMDPGTFSLQKLYALKQMGFNRISLGVQSFDDKILESIGRIHRRKDIIESIAMIQKVFGSDSDNDNDNNKMNYSIDLISGLPGLSMALWTETLSTAVNGTLLNPPPNHISLYDLQIEQGTVFGNWYNHDDGDDDINEDADDYYGEEEDGDLQEEEHQTTKRIASTTSSKVSQQTRGSSPVSSTTTTTSGGMIFSLPSPEDCAFMYKYAAGYLRAKGYEHYEVSSYALSSSSTTSGNVDKHNNKEINNSNRSQHNQIYWAIDGQWYAIGLGATSFVHGETIARPKTMVDYQEWVQRQRQLSLQQDEDEEDEKKSATTMTKTPPLSRTESANVVDDEQEDDNDPMSFLTDVVMKRLRTSDGLDLDWIQEHYGQEIVDAILRGVSLGLDLGLARVVNVVVDSEEGDHVTTRNANHHDNEDPKTTLTQDHNRSVLRLMDPDGFLYSNNIISSIFLELGEFDEED